MFLLEYLVGEERARPGPWARPGPSRFSRARKGSKLEIHRRAKARARPELERKARQGSIGLEIIPSERAFSNAGNVITNRRTKLGKDLANMLITLHTNLK